MAALIIGLVFRSNKGTMLKQSQHVMLNRFGKGKRQMQTMHWPSRLPQGSLILIAAVYCQLKTSVNNRLCVYVNCSLTKNVKTSNQIRALLLEFGVPIAKGDKALRKAIPEVLEDAENSLTVGFRIVLDVMYQNFQALLEKIELVSKQLGQEVKKDKLCRRLQSLEGVGPICAIQLKIALSQTGHYAKGREASACIGLTPVQHSSGGKQKLGSISKKSNHNTLRSSLYQGALAVVVNVDKREARTHKDIWLKALIARRGKKVASIALANKTVRTAFAMIKNNQEYKPQLLAA